jgi:hypothetical protein
MNRKTGFARIPVAACLGGTVFALLGCQQESAPTVTSGESDYATEVQKLKSGSEESFDAGLAALDAKFGYGTAAAEIPKPVGGSVALEKAAAQVYTATGDCTGLQKFIFSAVPGDRVVFKANSVNEVNVGKSDPVAMLIQFNHPEFIKDGIIPEVTQADFKILEWNDDVVFGNLSASIAHTFTAEESGHFMVMAYPYSNTSSTRLVGLKMDIFRVNCPTCDLVIQDPVRRLGGLVYNIKGANDFRANKAGADGNPRLYVIMNSLHSGMSNGDANYLTRNSKVFPYFVSADDGLFKGNRVLIDNEVAGTASITHIQYSP